jgi:hypothetical protein
MSATLGVFEDQFESAVSQAASDEHWKNELRKAGLTALGGFRFKRPRPLPEWKPVPAQRPSRAMAPFAEQQLRRERLGESIGRVWGEARPLSARRVRLKSRSFTLKEKRQLLELGYNRDIILDCERPATPEGPDGAYLAHGDRRRHQCAGMDSDNQQHPSSSASAFPAIPVPHAPYRSTGQEAFERRLKDHEAKQAISRISDAATQWAVYEVLVKGRLPGDVVAERESVDLETVYSYAKRARRKYRGPKPKKSVVARDPIAFKILVIDGQEHTVSVYPPATRKGRFARRTR